MQQQSTPCTCTQTPFFLCFWVMVVDTPDFFRWLQSILASADNTANPQNNTYFRKIGGSTLGLVQVGVGMTECECCHSVLENTLQTEGNRGDSKIWARKQGKIASQERIRNFGWHTAAPYRRTPFRQRKRERQKERTKERAQDRMRMRNSERKRGKEYARASK